MGRITQQNEITDSLTDIFRLEEIDKDADFFLLTNKILMQIVTPMVR